jgi:antitoxin HicB
VTNDGLDIKGYRLEVYRDPEDGSWAAEVPDLPGCVGAGESVIEAIEQVEDAIDAWIVAAKADGRPVPGPRVVDEDYSGRTLLRLPKSLHRRVATASRREGVSLNTYCVMSLAQSVGLSAGIAMSSGNSLPWLSMPVLASNDRSVVRVLSLGYIPGTTGANPVRQLRSGETQSAAITREEG